ncbi:MAG: hypothetical protein ACK4JE_04375 [Endomicrobiia bacterium]
MERKMEGRMGRKTKKINVGIIGATGMVGQKYVALLQKHPWFEISVVAASEKSGGKKYKEAIEEELNISDEEIFPWNKDKIKNQVEIEIKYSGYIKRQLQEIEKFRKLENKKIPHDFDYDKVRGLLKEAQIKLKQIRPESIGQASRISGVTPSDIAILLVHLKKSQNQLKNF